MSLLDQKVSWLSQQLPWGLQAPTFLPWACQPCPGLSPTVAPPCHRFLRLLLCPHHPFVHRNDNAPPGCPWGRAKLAFVTRELDAPLLQMVPPSPDPQSPHAPWHTPLGRNSILAPLQAGRGGVATAPTVGLLHLRMILLPAVVPLAPDRGIAPMRIPPLPRILTCLPMMEHPPMMAASDCKLPSGVAPCSFRGVALSHCWQRNALSHSFHILCPSFVAVCALCVPLLPPNFCFASSLSNNDAGWASFHRNFFFAPDLRVHFCLPCQSLLGEGGGGGGALRPSFGTSSSVATWLSAVAIFHIS